MSKRETTYLVIGGGIAARDALKSLRKKAPEASITMVTDEPHLPYDRPPLTKEFLWGEKPLEKVFLEKPDFYEENSIATVVGQPVTALDPEAHTATLADETVIQYEKALLATGGRPAKLPVDGADLTGVYYLRTLDDSLGIKEAAGKGKQAIVIGGGFIGLELAASLSEQGCEVTLIEAGPHIWPKFAHPDLAHFFQDYLTDRGIKLMTEQTVASINGEDTVVSVSLGNGEKLPADMVCIGIGIRPNVELAEAAGLEVDNGIVVDEQLRTSHPDIYAAGDVINYYDVLFDKRRRVEHWSHATFSGRLAGMNMAGGDKAYEFLSFVWSDIFDLHLKFVGDHSDYDELIERGDKDSAVFTLLYVRDGKLTACFTVNGDQREFSYLKMLIQRGFSVGAHRDDLANPRYELKTLVMAK